MPNLTNQKTKNMITIDELKTYGCDSLTDYFDKVLDAYSDGFVKMCKLMTSTMDREQRDKFIEYIYTLYHYEITDDENVIEEVSALIRNLNL